RSQTVEPGKSYVGRAGDTFISEDEFLQRFELLPGLYRQRKPQLEQAKLEFLYSLIAEKLLVQEAIARGLDADSLFQASFNEVRKLILRDQLYREEVIQKVVVTEEEITRGTWEAQRQLLASFVFFDKKEDAEFVRGQLKWPKDFETLQLDSTMKALRDTATVIWGEAEPSIEEAAFKLKPGEVSSVVRAGDGYYILKLSKVQKSGYYASMQPTGLRERVASKIRLRKEEARMDEFVREILKDKIGYALPEPFKLLAKSLAEVYERQPQQSLIWLTEEMVKEVRAKCSSRLKDTLVVVGEKYWTVGEVIARLNSARFVIGMNEIKRISHRLNTQIKVWVHQELLALEGARRGLDQRPGVRQQLDMWSSHYLAEFMKEYLKKRVTVSESEIWSHLQTQDKDLVVPQVRIRGLRTGSIQEMREAMFELQSGATLEALVDKWSNDPEAKGRRGLSDFFSITDRQPVGEIAWQMQVGERYGPLQVPKGFLLFELVGKKSAPLQKDTSLIARKEKAAQEVLRMKQRKLLMLFLAQVGEQRGFDIYQERLAQIRATPTPMMTFRILGFGGRMFAVPFVERRLDW
ncbi:MAG: peptidyl-prolyl cis-trans isomerase, partial [Bacteroidota bacterium]